MRYLYILPIYTTIMILLTAVCTLSRTPSFDTSRRKNELHHLYLPTTHAHTPNLTRSHEPRSSLFSFSIPRASYTAPPPSLPIYPPPPLLSTTRPNLQKPQAGRAPAAGRLTNISSGFDYQPDFTSLAVSSTLCSLLCMVGYDPPFDPSNLEIPPTSFAHRAPPLILHCTKGSLPIHYYSHNFLCSHVGKTAGALPRTSAAAGHSLWYAFGGRAHLPARLTAVETRQPKPSEKNSSDIRSGWSAFRADAPSSTQRKFCACALAHRRA
jgi:hypothetical protein